MVLLFGVFFSLIHITGLVLLTKTEDVTINGNQKYLIVALSLTELGSIVLSVIAESIFYGTGSTTDNLGLCTYLYELIVIGFMYYFIMFAITLDRFLELHLSIRYHLYWNKNKTKNTLILVFCILNVPWVVFLGIILSCQRSIFVLNIDEKIRKIYYTYFASVTDTINVIFAGIVYFYIFYKMHRNKKKEEKLRKQLKCSEIANVNAKVNRYRVPFWIIITFILFCVVPDILILTINPDTDGYVHLAVHGLYGTGYIADAIIYIFNLNHVQIKLGQYKRNILQKYLQEF